MFARVVLLPLLLALAVVLGLGSYFETSDDATLAWLFAGGLSAQKVHSVPLYLHGYGQALAAGYAAAPAVPWLGLLLGALLTGATVLWFAVIERLLRPYLRPAWLLLALSLFFAVAWLEHWLWFSHARVALLLAAGGVLFAAQRPGRNAPLFIALLGLLAAWLVRPSLALLGYTAVLPASVWLVGSLRRAAPLVLSGALLLALAFGLFTLSQTPAEARVQARDARLARILDYEQLSPFPRTAADSLGTDAIGLWLLGDSTVVDPVLRGSVYRFDAADFFGRVVPAKLKLRAGLLLRDYFPLLLALLTAGVQLRVQRGVPRGFWLVQLGFGAALGCIAAFLKLPPRLELPLLDCWLVTNLVFWLHSARNNGEAAELMHSRKLIDWRGIGLGGALASAVLLAYAAKTWHRHQVLAREQYHHEKALAEASRMPGPRVVILSGANDWLKSLSPFRMYGLGLQPTLLLTGWPAHDVSQAGWRLALSGTPDQTQCLRQLAYQAKAGADPTARWLLTPATARWLCRRFRYDGIRLWLVPSAPMPILDPKLELREYRPQLGREP